MIDRHFIIEVDHMDELTADTTMDIVEARQYPGVINSHGDWSSDPTIAADRRRSAGPRASTRTRTRAPASALTSTGSRVSPGRRPLRSAIRSDRTIAARTSIARRMATGRSTSTPTASPPTACGSTGSRGCASAGQDARLDALFRSAEDYLRMWKAATKHQG